MQGNMACLGWNKAISLDLKTRQTGAFFHAACILPVGVVLQ
ncbi:MAG: hypothetical protein O6928_03375 [Gammaproteobacteria bacterium]|nr:hypothetical protein [Gammaproteobacteria bacterium]